MTWTDCLWIGPFLSKIKLRKAEGSVKKKRYLNLAFSLSVCLCFYQYQVYAIPVKNVGRNKELSPYTGYTRATWLKITEKIIAGALRQFNSKTGLPDFEVAPLDPGYEAQRWKTPEESKKRALERIMMAVVIYTKATGKDNVPGIKGSISAPFISALTEGTNPRSQSYWGEPLPNDQVGSVFAMAAYIEPARYWDPLSKETKINVLNYFKKQAYNKTHNNNHYFFHMVPVALLEQNGYDANRDYLTQMYDRLMGWYRGDGWFLDGNNRGFDYYNLWGFQLFNQVLYRYDRVWRQRFGCRVKKSTGAFLKSFPYLFGRDGAPVPWGRSLAYRFAGNSAIAWSVLNHMSDLPPGEARRIASGSLKYFYEHGCLDDKGLLTIGYWGANAAVAEGYLDYGDPYWAAQGLACLLIPARDRFWTDVEKPIPADLYGGKKQVNGAQFTLRVSSIDGEARMFPAGQPWAKDRSAWQAGAKYDQHAYSSFLGFCLPGEGSEEIGAGRTGYSYDKLNWHFRQRAKSILISKDRLVSTYTLDPADQKDTVSAYNRDEIVTNTIIGNDGEIHVFWHTNPDPIYLSIGGYGITVASENGLSTELKKDRIKIDARRYHSTVRAILAPEGKFDFNVLPARKGWSSSHLYGGRGAYPLWRSTMPVKPNIPLVFYVNGTRDRKIRSYPIQVTSRGSVMKIKFEGKWHNINLPFNNFN